MPAAVKEINSLVNKVDACNVCQGQIKTPDCCCYLFNLLLCGKGS